MNAVGVDIGGTKIFTALVNEKGNIIKSVRFPTLPEKGKNYIMRNLKDSIYAVSRNEKIKGIGISVASPVDSKSGKILGAPNLGCMKNFFILREIRRKFKTQVLLENDVNAYAFAEYRLGAGRKAKNMACITLGTGVGGAIITNGKIYRGSGGIAGEFGHQIIDANGPKCSCGSKGCLEAFVGGNAIMKRARKAGLKFKNPAEIEQAAKKGNKNAGKVYDETAFYLGIGLANIANILNPDIIVIGGGIANAGILYPKAKKSMKSRCWKAAYENAKIKKSMLGNSAAAIGAALLVLENER